LFGYDPVEHQIGRGVLEALGIDFELNENDIAVRGNFCTVDDKGIITDRRAGRISTDKNNELCSMLSTIKLPDVKLFVEPVKEHRIVLVLRGDNLSPEVHETDPLETGKKPISPEPLVPEAEFTSRQLRAFHKEAARILKDYKPANMVLLRGFSKKPNWLSMYDNYGLNSLAIAAYPIYRGVSKLVGMDCINPGDKPDSEIQALSQHWNNYDFFFLHFKATDSAGEDGDFDRKVGAIEDVDRIIPDILALKPDVIIITGDHSTPAVMKNHSWHPVPFIIWSEYCRPDGVESFGEKYCQFGSLGSRLPTTDIMPLALANARRLKKFGA
jgi:2,3-bisphosphoglycerate-independent phosphoglycerate mutase